MLQSKDPIGQGTLVTPAIKRMSSAYKRRLLACAFCRSFQGNFAHFPAHLGAIHQHLLHDAENVAPSPVEREAGADIPGHETENSRHGKGHHALLRSINAG